MHVNELCNSMLYFYCMDPPYSVSFYHIFLRNYSLWSCRWLESALCSCLHWSAAMFFDLHRLFKLIFQLGRHPFFPRVYWNMYVSLWAGGELHAAAFILQTSHFDVLITTFITSMKGYLHPAAYPFSRSSGSLFSSKCSGDVFIPHLFCQNFDLHV